MIRRGSFVSRVLALAIAGSPLLAALAAYGVWAAQEWRYQGERLNAERALKHEYQAMTTQLRQYEPVRAVWDDYSSSDAAGLVHGATLEAAELTLEAHLEDVFLSHSGDWIGAERLPLRLEGDSLASIRVEARGTVGELEVVSLLSDLETSTPYIFIDAVDARRLNGSGPARIELRLRLSAFRMTQELQ